MSVHHLAAMAPTTPTTMGMGGDPHYSILLPTGQLLCYSVHGEHDFVFNLISNKLVQMNALFVADARREEVTWIEELGVVVRHGPRKRANTTALRFCAEKNMVCVGDKVKLQASGVERITFSQGKLSISERSAGGDVSKPAVLVEFPDIGLSFTVTFVRGRHLDMTWNKVEPNMDDSHGMIGELVRVLYGKHSHLIHALYLQIAFFLIFVLLKCVQVSSFAVVLRLTRPVDCWSSLTWIQCL